MISQVYRHCIVLFLTIHTNLLCYANTSNPVAILKNGKTTSTSSFYYDSHSNTVFMEKINVQEFSGSYLDFQGASLENVALINPTMEKIQHLNIESLGIYNLATGVGGGTRFVVINEKGNVTTASTVRWDSASHELQLTALSSFSRRPLEVRSNIDMKSNFIQNAKLAPNTLLSDLRFINGTIENSSIQNSVANNLTIHGMTVHGIKLHGISGDGVGSVLGVGELGQVQVFGKIKYLNDSISINEKMNVLDNIDFNRNDLVNVNIVSGNINGTNIIVNVDRVNAREISLTNTDKHKSLESNNCSLSGHLAIVTKEGGVIRRGPFSLTSDGALNDVRIAGTLTLGDDQDPEHPKGVIQNAILVKGEIVNASSLGVIGKASFENEVNIGGELFVGEGVIVNGPVLGAGPYIDASDSRFKTNVNQLSGKLMLNKLQQIRGVSYKFLLSQDSHLFLRNRDTSEQEDESSSMKGNHDKSEQLGFIAQEVEKIFPELVHTNKDGYKGIQYSRFIPVLVESINQMNEDVKKLIDEIHTLRRENDELRQSFKTHTNLYTY